MTTPRSRSKPDPVKLLEVHTRLFADDVELLKRVAAERRTPWPMELRLLVHRALKGERQEILILKEQA